MPSSSSRARQGMRALAAVSGIALVASSAALVSSPAQAADPVDIQILATNDFHGRLTNNTSNPAGQNVEAGAAALAGAVKQLRADNPNTVFAAAGDLIGATTFDSFIQQDKPTIDALNEAGLEVSAVGNHEFDQGYDDLLDRVMAPYDAEDNPYGGAEWQYIGANVKVKSTGDPAVPESWIKDFGDVEVGFVGAVTEHLDELVSPAGIADIEVTDVVAAANATADDLKAEGADVVVLLVHEGAPGTDCATMDDDPTSDFGSIIAGVNDNVDAIVSGHTHLLYDCSFPVAGWAGRPVTARPVVSAGQYGSNLNQLNFSVDPETGQVVGLTQAVLQLKTGQTLNYPEDPATKAIVDAAVAEANVLGAASLGDIAGPFKRASRPKADSSGPEENRGGESTLGNLVAEVQRWATETETAGAAQIAFMNPGGLRADMLGTTPGTYPTDLTYRQAANVQPFANTLVNMDMTGALIEEALEQQWQPEGASRPFLRLGSSDGFTYTYDPAAHEVTGMWLDGDAVKAGETYSVTVNSFLASGGDNFPAFAEGTGARDTGKSDLQSMVDYLAEFAADAPLPVDYGQHAVGVTFPEGAPAKYGAGDTLAFDLSSLAMTGQGGDVQDDEVIVSVGDEDLGTFPVDNTVAPGALFDESGTASVSVTLPAGLPGGAQAVTVTGPDSGTSASIPVTFEKSASSISAKAKPDKVIAKKTRPTVSVTVRSGGQPAVGKVELKVGGNTYRATLKKGKAEVRLPAFGKAGEKQVKIRYLGNASTNASTASVTITVTKK